MMNLKSAVAAVMGVSLAIGAGVAVAADGRVVGRVTGVLINGEGTYGGCLVRVAQSPHEQLSMCKPSWLSFDCAGTYGIDVVSAYRMVDLAQMAQALNLAASIQFSDDDRYEQDGDGKGYCVAHQINVLR